MTEEPGTTLWEVFRRWLKGEKEKSQELTIFNPLKAKPGDFIKIDTANLASKNFMITMIDEYKRTVGQKTLLFADYVLQDNEMDTWVTLRVNPVADANPDSKKHCDVLVLYPDKEFEYDEDFHKKILPDSVLNVTDEKGEILATYSRLSNMKKPYSTTVTEVKEDEEVAPEKISYWDYWREVDGINEFYFVEMNEETGWFQAFRGEPVSEQDVRVIRRES